MRSGNGRLLYTHLVSGSGVMARKSGKPTPALHSVRWLMKPVCRFLCPPPTACVVGLPWWQADDKGTLRPPSINISITGEHSVPSSTPFWTTIQNKVYEETAKLRLTPSERPFVGKVSNKGLHISDGTEPKEDKKGRTIKAVMAVHCRREDGQLGQEIGSFESKEIKIVSKPSKKRSSVRTSDRECPRTDPDSRRYLTHVASSVPAAWFARYAVQSDQGADEHDQVFGSGAKSTATQGIGWEAASATGRTFDDGECVCGGSPCMGS